MRTQFACRIGRDTDEMAISHMIVSLLGRESAFMSMLNSAQAFKKLDGRTFEIRIQV